MSKSTIPQSVVDRDHELDQRTDRASEALAKHRWHQCLDPDGPQHSLRSYADAVGRAREVIGRYANGYALFIERSTGTPAGTALSIQDAIRLAGVKEEDRAMHEAIAQGSGRPVSQVSRGDNRHRTKDIIHRAKDRSERRGTDPVDEARNIAAEERRVAEARRNRQQEERQRHTLKFVHIEGELANAQRRLMNALREAEGVDFTDEEMELMRASIANIRAVLNLIDARMAGTPDIDWDAELQKLGGG